MKKLQIARYTTISTEYFFLSSLKIYHVKKIEQDARQDITAITSIAIERFDIAIFGVF
jgi:hypothetical protein